MAAPRPGWVGGLCGPYRPDGLDTADVASDPLGLSDTAPYAQRPTVWIWARAQCITAVRQWATEGVNRAEMRALEMREFSYSTTGWPQQERTRIRCRPRCHRSRQDSAPARLHRPNASRSPSEFEARSPLARTAVAPRRPRLRRLGSPRRKHPSRS